MKRGYGEGKFTLRLKNTCFSRHTNIWKLSTISSGLSLADVETQPWTVVAGVAALWPLGFGPLAKQNVTFKDVLILQRLKDKTICQLIEKKVMRATLRCSPVLIISYYLIICSLYCCSCLLDACLPVLHDAGEFCQQLEELHLKINIIID